MYRKNQQSTRGHKPGRPPGSGAAGDDNDPPHRRGQPPGRSHEEQLTEAIIQNASPHLGVGPEHSHCPNCNKKAGISHRSNFLQCPNPCAWCPKGSAPHTGQICPTFARYQHQIHFWHTHMDMERPERPERPSRPGKPSDRRQHDRSLSPQESASRPSRDSYDRPKGRRQAENSSEGMIMSTLEELKSIVAANASANPHGYTSGSPFGNPTSNAFGNPLGNTFGNPAFGTPSGTAFGNPSGNAFGSSSGTPFAKPADIPSGKSSGKGKVGDKGVDRMEIDSGSSHTPASTAHLQALTSPPNAAQPSGYQSARAPQWPQEFARLEREMANFRQESLARESALREELTSRGREIDQLRRQLEGASEQVTTLQDLIGLQYYNAMHPDAPVSLPPQHMQTLRDFASARVPQLRETNLSNLGSSSSNNARSQSVPQPGPGINSSAAQATPQSLIRNLPIMSRQSPATSANAHQFGAARLGSLPLPTPSSWQTTSQNLSATTTQSVRDLFGSARPSDGVMSLQQPHPPHSHPLQHGNPERFSQGLAISGVTQDMESTKVKVETPSSPPPPPPRF